MKAIVHADAVLPGGVLPDAVILIDGGKISAVGAGLPVPRDAEIIDAGGMYAGPGFVDIHIHGSGRGGCTWEDAPEEVAAHHLRHGTTSVNAYLGYGSSKEALLRSTHRLQSAIDAGYLPTVCGIGFEGPYINPERGAGSKAHARPAPDESEYTALYEACRRRVVQWMYAPEMDKDGRFGAFLREHGITAAVGHSNASPQQIRNAVDLGASIATHLFDAMGCWLGTESAAVTGTVQDSTAVGCLICPELIYEIIPDSRGVHVKPANIKLVYQLAGPRRIAIITDCTTCGYDPADYPAEHPRSAADLNFNESGELSGSTLTMDQAVRSFQAHTGAPVQDLFQMAASTPARAVHIDHLTGSLAPGKFADLVLLDKKLRLEAVIFHGSLVDEALIHTLFTPR